MLSSSSSQRSASKRRWAAIAVVVVGVVVAIATVVVAVTWPKISGKTPTPRIRLSAAFNDAADNVKTLGSLDDATKLKLYGLYKQATMGDCDTERPSVLNMKERAKWDAWKALSGKPKADAESDYIRLVKSMLNKQPTGSDAPPAGAEPGWVSTCRKAAGDLWAYIKAQYAKVQDRIPFGTKNQA
ncbi:ACB domain-containing protein [Plasmodiophora brassicae]